ncbi:hypothetical protein QAD02_020555 [Eretmocerus hayati]|uniref:Uncharacterized protein n=1 Tax=Eretmocerus hayati TaxID=131215 RepID=A0ACC2PQY5_9HYME|nr:hypothetical protein QAD02_020555 [Eretmocerus hayati]
MGATMKDRFTTAGLADAYSVLEKNGIDSLEILEDFIHKRAEKFGEWFPVLGTQLKIERMCKDRVAEENSSQSDDIGNALQSSNHTEQSSNNTEQSNSHTGDASGPSIVIQQPVPQGDVVILAIGNESGTVILPSTCPQTKAPQKKVYKSSEPEVVNFDLRALLERKPLGRALLNIYKSAKTFNTAEQSYFYPDGQESKVLLQCGDYNNDPEETKKLWALALKIRISEILALQKRTIQLVLTHWPTLTLNEYQDLVHFDYTQRNSGTLYDGFCLNWDNQYNAIVRLFESKLDGFQKTELNNLASESSIGGSFDLSY